MCIKVAQGTGVNGLQLSVIGNQNVLARIADKCALSPDLAFAIPKMRVHCLISFRDCSIFLTFAKALVVADT